MLIFDQLRPLVFACQIFGVIPFYMETDPDTNQFKKFSFSWKRPVTWWFICFFIANLIFLPIYTRMFWQIFYNIGVVRSNVPLAFIGFMLMEHIFFFLLIVMARYILFKYSHFHRAISLIQKVHNLLDVESLESEKFSSTKHRVIFGLISAFFCVSFVVNKW